MKIKYPVNWKLGIASRIMGSVIYGRQETFLNYADKAFEAEQDKEAVDNLEPKEMVEDNFIEIEK